MRAPRDAYMGSHEDGMIYASAAKRCAFSQMCVWLESVCVSSRWKVLSGEFRRRPTALAKKIRELDRVGRRGLFESRENFSRLLTYAFPWLFPSLFPPHFSLRTSSSANTIQPPKTCGPSHAYMFSLAAKSRRAIPLSPAC